MIVAINLISDSQIYFNLKRTAAKGLISLLDKNKLHNLALKYFKAKDEFGNTIGYMCPYSGKIIHNPKDIVLEHIIPVDSNGGTVLFNCIPTSSEVNKLSEKGAKHLISWWKDSNYWDTTAPKRLESIVNYMLDAYDIVFKEYTLDEVEESYLNIEGINNDIDNNSDLSVDERKEFKELKEQAKSNGITSYLGFILDCINELERNNINTENIRKRLQSLSDKNIFKDVNKYEMYQNIIQRVIKESLVNDNNKYLTYSLNIDIKKLMNSINLDNENDIYSEIRNRISYIINILNQNNISLIDYYDNLRDIKDIDILYKDINSLTEEDINNFIANCIIGHKTKIKIFIEMIKRAKSKEELSKIFNQRTNKLFTTYKKDGNGNYIEDKTYGEIGQFWSHNKEQIQPILDKIIEDDTVLRDKLDDYYINTFSGQTSVEGKQRRINIFIEMIKRAKSKEELSEIFKQGTSKPFTTYKKDGNGNYIEDKTYGEIGYFWNSNKEQIQPILEKIMEDDTVLRDKLDNYYMNTRSGQTSVEGNQRRINIFIEMIKRAKSKEELSKIFKDRANKPFTTYKKDVTGNYIEDKTYGKIGKFWRNNKEQIQPILEKIMEDDTVLRDKLDDYYMNTKSGQTSVEGKQRRINIFIEMLKRAKSNEELSEIFKGGINKPFTTYKKDANGNYIEDKTYGKIGQFWNSNKEQIQPILEKIMEDDTVLKDKLDDYYINTFSGQNSIEGKQRRINIFIEMIKNAKSKEELLEIFKTGTNKPFTTYKKDANGNYIEDKTYGEIGRFWSTNKDKNIIPQLFFTEKYLSSEYDTARKRVMDYLNSLRTKRKLPEFRTINEYIDTLDKKKKEVKVLIELRDSLLSRKEQLVIENESLKEQLNTSYGRAM